jgi:nicotinamide-nucleotide amidase
MVALLSIGTELCTGQILNKNAQWLSIELLKLGISVSYQITVPDDHHLIHSALKFLEPMASVVLITGGLGPTADDFTRKVLADTFQRPLQWHDENWLKVQNKLNSRGVQIRPVHRQQCEYPQGAEILDNAAGIADGFCFTVNNRLQIYAIPGPPKELASLWENSIRDRLATLTPAHLRWTQKIWTTSGLPESEVASKVNEALGDAASQVLYRVHSPCVDVKLLFQQKDFDYNQTLGQKIKNALEPWLVSHPETKE